MRTELFYSSYRWDHRRSCHSVLDLLYLISSRSMHGAKKGRISLFYGWITFCFFTYSPTDVQLSCFHVLTIMDNIAINMYFQHADFISPWNISSKKTAESCALGLIFWWTYILILHNGYTNWHYYHACITVPLIPKVHQYLWFLSFW
jgi:hypothetical protein